MASNVKGTFHYRTISELQNSSQILRLFVVHSALLLSSVYSARILEEFHLIHLDLSPTSCLSQFYETGRCDVPILIFQYVSAYLMATKLPCIINVYCFMVSTHIDLRSMLRLVSHLATCFSGTVGTRFPDAIALTSVTNGVFYPSTGWRHQFLLNMLILCVIYRLFFVRSTLIKIWMFMYSIQFTTLPCLYNIVFIDEPSNYLYP